MRQDSKYLIMYNQKLYKFICFLFFFSGFISLEEQVSTRKIKFKAFIIVKYLFYFLENILSIYKLIINKFQIRINRSYLCNKIKRKKNEFGL